MEPESTRVGIAIPGIKLGVSWSIKELGLERADALRCSMVVALIRSMQPWSGAGARGSLPNFLTLWSRSVKCWDSNSIGDRRGTSRKDWS